MDDPKTHRVWTRSNEPMAKHRDVFWDCEYAKARHPTTKFLQSNLQRSDSSLVKPDKIFLRSIATPRSNYDSQKDRWINEHSILFQLIFWRDNDCIASDTGNSP